MAVPREFLELIIDAVNVSGCTTPLKRFPKSLESGVHVPRTSFEKLRSGFITMSRNHRKYRTPRHGKLPPCSPPSGSSALLQGNLPLQRVMRGTGSPSVLPERDFPPDSGLGFERVRSPPHHLFFRSLRCGNTNLVAERILHRFGGSDLPDLVVPFRPMTSKLTRGTSPFGFRAHSVKISSSL